MEAKYLQLLKSQDFDYRLNLGDIYLRDYHDFSEYRKNEYRRLVFQFMQDCGLSITVEEAYEKVYNHNSIWNGKPEFTTDKIKIVEYLEKHAHQFEASLDIMDIIDGQEVPLECYMLDSDVTLDYFDPRHNHFYDLFFYFKLISLDEMNIQRFLDYQLNYQFSNDRRIFLMFLMSFLDCYKSPLRVYTLPPSVFRQVEYWIQSFQTYKVDFYQAPKIDFNFEAIKTEIEEGGEGEERETDTPYISNKQSGTSLGLRTRICNSIKSYFDESNFEQLKMLLSGQVIDKPIVFKGSGALLCNIIRSIKKAHILEGKNISEWICKNFNSLNGKNTTPSQLQLSTVRDNLARDRYLGIRDLNSIILEVTSVQGEKRKR